MNFCDFSDVTVRGELGARCALLSARLEAPIYRPESVYRNSNDWPGDWSGRTILALSCLSGVTKREPSYLDDIVKALRGELNERGYLREILDGQLNEQQLSGHSWLLRGLCEYYLYRKDSEPSPLSTESFAGFSCRRAAITKPTQSFPKNACTAEKNPATPQGWSVPGIFPPTPAAPTSRLTA
jgi:hypothetical protein